MEEIPPKLIYILPDYGPSYANDEDHCALNITSCFDDHPNIAVIRDIEEQLYGLASWLDYELALVDDKSAFPWKEYEKEVFQLAQAMADALGDVGIPIYYRPHFNNPYVANRDRILMSK